MEQRSVSKEHFLDRAGTLKERIGTLGGNGVDIVAVTKGFGAWAMTLALECGFQMVGENYAQELSAKWPELNIEERKAGSSRENV